MDAQRNGAAGRKPEILGGQALLIESVTGFVEHAEER